MPLTMVGVGESRPILRIGGSDKVRTHLENLGFVVGGSVIIVNTMGEKASGKSGLCRRQRRHDHQHARRQCDRQREGGARGHQPRIGDQDSGLSSIGAESEHTGGG